MQDKQYTISPKDTKCVESDIVFVLKVFAIIIFIGGIIGGIVLGKQFARIHNLFVTRYSDEVEFSWEIALLVWLSSLLEGSLLLALREVLVVLHIHQTQNYTIVLPADDNKSEESSCTISNQHTSTTQVAAQPENTPKDNCIICPICGCEQPSNRHSCWRCGADLSK